MPSIVGRGACWCAVALLLLLLPFVIVAPAGAWTPGSQAAIAAQAAAWAPPDLRHQIEKHARELRRGALEAFQDPDAGHHVRNADGSGTLDTTIRFEAERATAMIRAHRPFAEIVYQLGRLTHFVADASNPLNASNADANEAAYYSDFLRYAESASPRFAVVYYGLDERLATAKDLGPLANSALGRGRNLYPRVAGEYRRIGQIAGAQLFDDRSTAFALAAISYSHAVSDAANALRFVWLRGGGADTRPLPAMTTKRLVLLDRAAARP